MLKRLHKSSDGKSTVGNSSIWSLRSFNIRQYGLVVIGLLVLAGGILIFASGGNAACTQTLSPGASVTSAVNGASPGTVICLNPGSYSTGSFTHGGNASAPVTLTSVDPKNPATLTGRTVTEGGASYLNINNLKFVYTAQSDPITVVLGTPHVNFTYNDVSGAHITQCINGVSYGGSTVSYNLIDHNLVHDCQGSTITTQGIYMLGGPGDVISNNWCWNADARCYQIRGENGGIWRNNVSDSSGSGYIYGDLSPANNNVYNNIVGSVVRDSAYAYSAVGGGNSFHDNCISKPFGSNSNNVVALSNNTVVQVQFVDAANHNYNLSSASVNDPCRSYGVQGGNPGPGGAGGSTTPPPPPPPPDTTPPTVSMSTPTNGATVTGTATLDAAASDNIAIAKVQFKLDGASLGAAELSAPYSITWDTTKATNGSHTLTATATDTSGNSATANTVTITVNNQSSDTTPPSVPTGLSAAAPTSASVKLSWSASTDNVGVKSYKVYRNGSPNALTTVSAPTTTFTDSTVSAGTTYSYTVSAQDGAGNSSSQSSSASVTTPKATDTTPPSVPTGLSGQATGTTAVALTWNAATDNAGGSGLAGYHVYRGSALVASPTTTSYTDSGLTPATAYTYSVVAFDNAANASAASAPATVTTQSSSVQFSCNGVTAFICNDFSSSATGFTTVGGTWTAAGGTYSLSSPAQATDANKLLYNQALNTKSVPGNFTLTFDGSTPSTNAFADFGAIFDATDSNNYYYIDYNHTDDSGTNGIFKVANGTQTKLADFPVTITSGTTYSTKVVRTGSTITVYRGGTLLASATDSTFTAGKVGLGSRNDAASFDSFVVTTPVGGDTQAPTVPTGLSATAPTSSQVNLSWNPSTDNVAVSGYRIYRNGASTPITTVTSPSFGNTGLSAGTAYTYTVSAIDAAGNESAKSAPASVTTPASGSTVTLSGAVTNSSSGKAISGANVRTGKRGTPTGAASATTNASGNYILSGITPGTHFYEYSAHDYKSQEFILKFAPGSFTKNVGLVQR